MRTAHLVFALASTCAFGCVEGGNLAVSGGAPVAAAVEGRISRCAQPVMGADVLLLVQQDRPEQSQPVDARFGPVVSSRDGSYLVQISPAFAVPGAATFQLRINGDGRTQDIPGGTLDLQLGVPARDTTRFDVDLGVELNQC